jgi:hypothetical protein
MSQLHEQEEETKMHEETMSSQTLGDIITMMVVSVFVCLIVMNDYLKTKLYRTTQKALSYYSDS